MTGRIKITHNKNLLIFIAILFGLFIVFVVYAFNQNKNFGDGNDNNEVECVNDNDCVPNVCCHASSCVPVKNAIDCSDIFCTTVCIEGTLDCGQGNCLCVDGKCNAVYK